MLGDNGFLPPGRRQVSTNEFREFFVSQFPGSANREALFDAWVGHREELGSIVTIRSQWVGGSFVSDKLEPSDIDVITLFDGPSYEHLSRGAQALADKLMSGPRTSLIYGIDSYPLGVYPEGHLAHKEYLAARGYWDWWLGRVKDDDSAERGYLEVLA